MAARSSSTATGRPRQLHEREHALLHARPAGGGEDDERPPPLLGRHHAGDDRLAGRHAERAAHEIEILHRRDHRQRLDRAGADQHGIGEAGLGPRVAQAVGVAALVAEFQRVERHLGEGDRLPRAAVEEMGEALGRGHPHVEAGARDDELVRLEVAMEDHLAGLGTFDPQVLRHLPLGEEVADLGTDDVADPAHADTFIPVSRRAFGPPRLLYPGPGRALRPSAPLVPVGLRFAYSAATARAPRTPSASSATRSVTAATVPALARPAPSSESRTALTSADPTTTPSAVLPMARAWSAVLTPKPTATGNMVCRLILVTASATRVVSGRGGAGDAEDRDVVDEARRIGEHRRQPLVVGGRRRQPDEADAVLHRRQAELVIGLRRQVDDDQPVDAGGLGIGEKALAAIGIDRVVVAHQHDRRVGVARAKGAHHGERLDHGLPGTKRAQRRHLDRRPLGHRIGERHAELDHVGTGRRAAPRGSRARCRSPGRRR